MVSEPLPVVWAATTSLPLMAVGGLAVLGWAMGRGQAILPRMAGVAVLLLALGGVLALGIYVWNGVEVSAAIRHDPWGAVLWFGWVGAQLAGLGIAITWARMLLGGKGAT